MHFFKMCSIIISGSLKWMYTSQLPDLWSSHNKKIEWVTFVLHAI